MAGALCFHCKGHGSLPGKGTKIPQASQHSQLKNFLIKKERNMLYALSNSIEKKSFQQIMLDQLNILTICTTTHHSQITGLKDSKTTKLNRRQEKNHYKFS